MSLKLIRIAKLKAFAASRNLVGPVAIGLAIGKKANQASDLMSGKAPFGEKVARSIEAYAGLPDFYLDDESETTNVTPGPKIRGSVPLLSNVQAGMFREVLDNNSGDSVEHIPTTVPVNRYTFALRVQGDSMEPKFTQGMLLIVEPELDPQNNDFVIVKNGSEETTFKQLVKDGDEWLLKPLNDRYPIKPLGKNTIIGVVRGVTEQFR